MSAALPSSRPYLLRAMHEWITDCGHTPQIVVNANVEGVHVPREYVQDGKIVLNISTGATQRLRISNDGVACEARFNGQSHDLLVPIRAVLGIYSRESGQGMLFGADDEPPPNDKVSTGGRPKLKVVK